MNHHWLPILNMAFSHRVAQLRKDKSWTQQQLADQVGVKVLQIRRYENGSSQPTLEVIKNLAIALSVTTDTLIFGTDERGPDDDLRIQFEAIRRMNDTEKQIIKSLLDGMIIKHQTNQMIGQLGS